MSFMAARVARRIASIVLMLTVSTCCSADDFSIRSGFAAKLTASMNSVADGKSFRDGLTDIAQRADVNVCIDRRVDPSAMIAAGSLGPTVLEAMAKIAEEADCVVLPLADVVLIGRAGWVDSTAAAILETAQSGSQKAAVNVTWGDLTTPSEAVSQVLSNGADIEPVLPHDLWPKTSWKAIDRTVALTLVLAQFDRVLVKKSAISRGERTIETTDFGESKQFRRRYSLVGDFAEIRSSVVQRDERARVRISGQWLEVVANPAAHRAAVALLLQVAGQGQSPDLSTRFSLRAQAPAKDLLARLAAAVGKQCRIEDAAAEAASQMVKIEGEEVPLRTLIQRVANQAGVKISWDNAGMVVSP